MDNLCLGKKSRRKGRIVGFVLVNGDFVGLGQDLATDLTTYWGSRSWLELVDDAAAAGVVNGRFAAIARAVESTLARRKNGHRIPMNIDGATAVIYAELGFAAPLARGLFCLSRSVGILAHAWEQTGQGGRNKGPMPRQYLWRYDGPAERAVPGTARNSRLTCGGG